MSVLDRLMKRPRSGGTAPANGASRRVSPEELTRIILDSLVGDQPLHHLNFRLWDGTCWPDASPRSATVVLNRPSALREMLLPGSEAGVGEAFLDQAFDVEGDIEAACELADRLMAETEGWTRKLGIAWMLRRLPEGPAKTKGLGHKARLGGRQHSLQRDREAISFHYNVSNDFYGLWLDRNMAYSCAYFHSPDDDLDTAQQNKFDHVCRKLSLKPGDRLLDVGCGWGGLMLHAMLHYGVEAEGITLSQEQLHFARTRFEENGLSGRGKVSLVDYRELPEDRPYDAIASVGMVEHVGRAKLPEYFGKVFRLLKPGGLFMNHGIGLGAVELPGQTGSFIRDHVFPDTELLPIGEMLDFAEGAGWGVRDVENLRDHYAMTLRHWFQRLEAKHDEALRHVDESTYRVWRLYMAGCAHNFRTGKLGIYQTLLARLDRDGKSRAPLTRAVWYRA